MRAYTIGDQDVDNYHNDRCWVRGTCKWETGYIVGNLVCGKFSVLPSFNITVNQDTPSNFYTFGKDGDEKNWVPFDDMMAHYVKFVHNFHGLPTQTIEGQRLDGEGDYMSLNRVNKAASGTGVGVGVFDASKSTGHRALFTITCEEFARYHSINIKGLPGKTDLVFLITGDNNCMFSNINILGSPDPTYNAFIFPDATNILVSEVSVPGSLVAPSAHIDAKSGQINGQVVAKSWGGMTQINNFNWGCATKHSLREMTTVTATGF